MLFIKKFCQTSLFACIVTSTAAAALADRTACSGGGLLSDFSYENAVRGFAAAQKQDGSVGLHFDPVQAGNAVARMSAGPKGKRVGKAGLIYRFAPVGVGRTVDMSARFFIPKGEKADSIILMDLECASCGLNTNPGMRLYLRDGRLRVDRSKIGIKEPFYPNVEHRIRLGQWHDIRWQVVLGDRGAGRSTVFLDGREVGRNTGTTVLTQRIVSQFTDVRVEEKVDRFQIGLTSNANRRRTELLLDDVRFCTS